MNDDSVLKAPPVSTTSVVSPQASQQNTPRYAKSASPQGREVEKDFVDAGSSGIVVRVYVMNGFRNRYSFSIGRMIPSQPSVAGVSAHFVTFIPVFVEVELARVSIRPYIGILTELLEQANEHIHIASQLREDDIIEQKQMGEAKEANRNKQQTRHTGKTQRVKDRRVGKGSNQ